VICIRQQDQHRQLVDSLYRGQGPVTTTHNTIAFLPQDSNCWQVGISPHGCDAITAAAVSCGKLYVFGELLFFGKKQVILKRFPRQVWL